MLSASGSSGPDHAKGMAVSERFETIILIGRPAAGKSEVIDFLKKTDEAERARRFRIGSFSELDDFPFVWETFEIDDLLERLGQPRVFTTEGVLLQGRAPLEPVHRADQPRVPEAARPGSRLHQA